jgi:DNA polymerase elongation subunit (family B)
MTQLKRLIFDCEVSPNIGFFWNPGHKINISYENIIKERAIICICYKWQGDKKTHSLQWDSKQDDKKMLKEFIKVANTADELVGHNGDKFDLAWIRTRCLYHKIDMFPSYTTVDTLKVARGKFRFNSNRLDYIGKFLGIGQKLHTGFDLWKNIALNDCERSMNKMVKYCKQDVNLLEKIFIELQNHIPVKTHAGVLQGKKKRSCPRCGSDRVKVNLTKVSAAGIVKKQLQCKNCGGHHTVAAKDL